jgi:hypothetical protein
MMQNIGRSLVLVGLLLAIIGGGLWLAGRLGLPLGRLPGDFRFEGKNFTFYFPLGSGLLISLLLTILINVVGRFINR